MLTTGIDELGRSVRLRGGDTLPGEMLGFLHLSAAQCSARDKRPDDARVHLAEATSIAARIGEQNGLGMHFGPTNVAVWRLGIGVELREGGRAYEEATRIPLDVATLGSEERSSALHFDLARALVQDGARRDTGPTPLWRALEDADQLWHNLGRPGWDRFGLTVTTERQWIWLDSPDSDHTWPLAALDR